jgi:hypothetical protein
MKQKIAPSHQRRDEANARAAARLTEAHPSPA